MVDVVAAAAVCVGVKFMFLVGGFSESPMLQLEIRNEFKHLVQIIIPMEVSLAILKGNFDMA